VRQVCLSVIDLSNQPSTDLIEVGSGGRVGTMKAAAIFQLQILGMFSLVAHHAAHGQQKLV
jgi:hypothetical protein